MRLWSDPAWSWVLVGATIRLWSDLAWSGDLVGATMRLWSDLAWSGVLVGMMAGEISLPQAADKRLRSGDGRGSERPDSER
jgi:hypothetical protein